MLLRSDAYGEMKAAIVSTPASTRSSPPLQPASGFFPPAFRTEPRSLQRPMDGTLSPSSHEDGSCPEKTMFEFGRDRGFA